MNKKERIGDVEFSTVWRGNAVVKMAPAGEFYPLYQARAQRAELPAWIDYGSHRGGLSLLSGDGTGAERPTVRTCRNKVAPDSLRLAFDFPRPIPPGQTWESSEIWLTPHAGGWAKGIETYPRVCPPGEPRATGPQARSRGAGVSNGLAIEAPERDPNRAYFKFRDLPRIAADAKAHGIDEISMINWCEAFTLPVLLRRELGTREELVAAVRACKQSA